MTDKLLKPIKLWVEETAGKVIESLPLGTMIDLKLSRPIRAKPEWGWSRKPRLHMLGVFLGWTVIYGPSAVLHSYGPSAVLHGGATHYMVFVILETGQPVALRFLSARKSVWAKIVGYSRSGFNAKPPKHDPTHTKLVGVYSMDSFKKDHFTQIVDKDDPKIPMSFRP